MDQFRQCSVQIIHECPTHLERAASLFNDMNGFQVAATSQPSDGLNSQACKVLLVCSQNFAAQSGLGYVE